MNNARNIFNTSMSGLHFPGNHIGCLYHEREDVTDAVKSFLMPGFSDGKASICFTATPEKKEQMVTALRQVLPDFDRLLNIGQLQILSREEWSPGQESFSPDEICLYLQEKCRDALQMQYHGLRIIHVMEGVRQKDIERLFSYELSVDRLARENNIELLCLYPLNTCDADTIIDIISYHDHVLVNRGGIWQDLKNPRNIQTYEQLEERYRMLFDGIQGGLVVVDPVTKKVILANQTFTGMFGYPAREDISNLKDCISDESVVLQLYQIIDDIADKALEVQADIRAGDEGEETWLRVFGKKIILDDSSAALISIWNITGQKQAEKRVKESEAKFSVAFRSSPNIMVITSLPEGVYIDVNDEFTRLTGYSREEVIGRKTRDLNTWAYPEERARMLRLVREKGRFSGEEFHFRMKSGEIRTWLHAAETISINGESCVLGVSVDVTERNRSRRLEQDEIHVLNLLGSQTDLTEILESIIHLGERYNQDVKGTVMLADEGGQKLMLGAAPSLPAEFHRIMENGVPVGPDMGSCGSAAYYRKRVLVTDIARSSLFSSGPAIAAMGLMACFSQPIIASDGGLLGTIAYYCRHPGKPDADTLRVLEWSARMAAIAIERRRNDEALKQSEQKYRILVENAYDIVYSLSPAGDFTYVSPSWTRSLGHEIDEVENRSFSDFLHPEDAGRCFSLIASVKESNETSGEIEYRVRHRNGSWRWHVSTISVMRDNEGKLTGFNGIARDITVQKEAEETLRESQKMFATIFRSSPDLMVMVDVASGTYLEANDAFCRVTGYPREAIVGHTVDEYDIWCNKEEREKFILQLKRNGKIRDEIIHFRTGSGEIRTLLCSADLLTLKGRQYHLGVAVDITERQKAEQAVIDSEEKFKGAFNASPAPMVLADDRGIYIDVNEAFIRHSGYAREQVIGKPSHEVNIWVFPEEVERINKIMEEEGRVVEEECHVYGKGGDIRTMLLSMEYLIISGRRYRLAVSLDITERKRAEERLMVSDAALKSIRDAVIIMDAQFNIIEWNTVSEQVFGVTAKEAIGRRFGEFVKLEEERPGHNRERWDILLKRGYNREEQLYHTPRGDMWADVRVQEIVKDGEHIGWVTLVVDVTPQKQAQEKLAEAYRQEKELRRSLEREAQKRLVFSHALVHELKTPLTPVMASSEILMSGLKEEPWVSLAKNIYHGGENLNKRIDELLDLARGEIGMLKLELSLFSPVELFNEIISEMLPFAAKRNQEVTASIPDSLPLIKGDKVRLRQVVSNIINNAFKFTDYGGKIHFSAKLDGGNLLVTISDNGMGMSEAEQARIFQPYERIEADRQRLSGLGLGLALSKNIIELHGGKIWVNSKKGKGSTFSFCIPVEGPPSQKNIDKQPVKKHKE